ncbi:MAG: hypothetical protein WBM15_06190 [Chromatiaceae bacterium]
MMTPHQRGYPYVEIAPGGPFGALSNALLSDFPITRSHPLDRGPAGRGRPGQ